MQRFKIWVWFALLYLVGSVGWHHSMPEASPAVRRSLTVGDVVENARLGERVTFTKLPTWPGGAAAISVTLEANAMVPVAHVHPHISETFSVSNGTLEVQVGDQIQILVAGQTATVLPGVPHAFKNASGDKVTFSVELNPGGQMPLALRELHAFLSSPPPNQVAEFLQMIRFAEAFDVYMAGVPVWMQKIAILCVAPTARLLGYRPYVTD